MTSASVNIPEYQKTGAIASVTLMNEGLFDGEEVVQIYIKNEDSKLGVKNPGLCGYQRVHVPKGEQKTIEIQIPANAFTVVDDSGNRIFDGNKYSLYVGTSQPDARSIELTGETPIKIELTV